MIRIEKSENDVLLTQLWGNPSIYNKMTDDGDPDILTFNVYSGPGKLFFIVYEDEIPIGIVAFFQKNYITLEAHIGFLKHGQGQALDACKLAIEWIKNNTPYKKIITVTPIIYWAQVGKLLQNLEFSYEGFSSNSFMKNGNLYGQYYYGLEV